MKHSLLAAALLASCLAAAPRAPAVPAPSAPSDPPPRLAIYPGDLTLVEEIETVRLPAGRTRVRLDFVRGNADVASLDVVPLDHPAAVRVVALERRDDLPNATFVELEADAAVAERLRISYAAHGLSSAVHYLAVHDAGARTLDLLQGLEVTNGSGESFEAADVQSVFGDVKTVSPAAVLHGRAPDPDPAAPAGLPAPPMRQELAEHTTVAFGESVALPAGVTIRRPTLAHAAAPATIEYRYDAAVHPRITRVLKVENREGAGLGGVTLQPGSLYLAERRADGSERFLRTGAVAHLPPGKELELEAGVASDMAVERELLDLARTELVFGEYNRALVSYAVEEGYRLEIRNHAAEARPLVVTEHVAGTTTFEVVESTVPATRKDQSTLQFKAEVPAGGTLELRYRVKKTNVQP
ncbi:MAG: hypothetical protein AB1726_16780 [Planctomycetota bacterium]